MRLHAAAAVLGVVFTSALVAAQDDERVPQRDPFDRSNGSKWVCVLLGPPPVDSITLSGIVKDKKGRKALLVTTHVWPPGREKMLVVMQGHQFYDGRITDITDSEVTIQEWLRGPEGQDLGPGQRVVRLSLSHPKDTSLTPPIE